MSQLRVGVTLIVKCPSELNIIKELWPQVEHILILLSYESFTEVTQWQPGGLGFSSSFLF